MARNTRWIYSFGNGKADGDGSQKKLLGGKGAGLAEMTRIGLPVPAGFTVTTDACEHYYRNKKQWPEGLEKELRANVAQLEKLCRKKLGSAKDPLLVSVRSGASMSMPGMMETILNLGMNNEAAEGLARVSGSRRFAFDTYRRFIMMYGSTAMGVERRKFDEAFNEIKETRTRPRVFKSSTEQVLDSDVNSEELESVVARFKEIYEQAVGAPLPQDPYEQLRGAINAVFDSWMAEKAVTYRRVEKITGLNGTAVNIMQMVFGNLGEDCGTGVCFTRDPSTGENELYGDLLINAQGEDVVAGIRTPLKLADLQTSYPEMYDRLDAVRAMLEVHYQEMQDLEFTFERGRLYMLQCRTGKRSPSATFKIAVEQATKPVLAPERSKELVAKKYLPKRFATKASKPVITREQAIRRIKDVDLERLFYPIIDPSIDRAQLESNRLGSGINAVPGAASGQAYFSAERAEQAVQEGKSVILVREETSPEDVGGMHAAVGILTARGGKTSHAAVVARGWGKCCIVGCDALRCDDHEPRASLNGRTIQEGDFLTLDGSSGVVYQGQLALTRQTAPPEYDTLMGWCDEYRRLGVRTNADTPQDARKAVALGAEGIGLCRTEHMFFDPSEPERLLAMRQMILAEDEVGRIRALDRLLPYQRKDFEGIFEAMHGKPVTIRLIDPPLHEFLPQEESSQRQVINDINASLRQLFDDPEERFQMGDRSYEDMEVTVEKLRMRIEQLHEFNPMLGHRGCRLCITYPEILEMQVRAIIEAALNCKGRGIDVRPEIMIPLSIDAEELRILVNRTRAHADAIFHDVKDSVNYLVGTMIETPRAALTAGKIGAVAEFFSFGTNDLTQMTMGLSRDDAGRFLPDYVDKEKAGIFEADPFQSLDVEGVGALVRMGVEEGRKTNPKLKIGICGEHGGDPDSIQFCHEVGMEYVSCSPYRVPIARLAAAQAVLAEVETLKATRSPASGRTARVAKKPTTKKRVRKAAPKKSPAKKVAKKKAAKKGSVTKKSRSTKTKKTKKSTKKSPRRAARSQTNTRKKKTVKKPGRKSTTRKSSSRAKRKRG